MPKIKKLISFDGSLLARIDGHAAETGQNRSEWIGSAALAYLHSNIDMDTRDELKLLVEAYLSQPVDS